MPPSKKTSDLPNPVLLQNAALELFSKYGYGGTTVRMIADLAGLSAGQVTVHFGGKEALYQSIIENMIRETSVVFDPINIEVEKLSNAGLLDREAAWKYIEIIVDLQLSFALSPEKHNDLMMVLLGKSGPEAGDASMLAKTLIAKIEHLLACLIMVYSDKKGYLRARTISRAVNGAIISFGEHPDLFLEEVYDGKFAPNSVEWMRKYLREFILTSIKFSENVDFMS